ncbi:hypothetical protein HF1_12170 [Mycoplasma haemofelis str. Langford 1]|uniref:Uncharacterized protein n=1 Tax=Mycoplasma haemofelis (strain Langford 1) TaxID=941640 RepID=E8ZJA4_MYCHL|nr:hypothetical protein [Mycoplasma haemofelis]CBY93225.1 hypothetical protein HF1_12170 [Mycoplasma haemofelis str. Langford 1]
MPSKLSAQSNTVETKAVQTSAEEGEDDETEDMIPQPPKAGAVEQSYGSGGWRWFFGITSSESRIFGWGR